MQEQVLEKTNRKEYNRRYYLAHREKSIAGRKKWYQEHKDYSKKQAKERYFRDWERQREIRRQWQKSNRPKVNISRAKLRARQREEIFVLLGGPRCARCGFTDKRALQVDHVNGGGNRERKEHGTNYYRWLQNVRTNPAGYQILCANCNWIKHYENTR